MRIAMLGRRGEVLVAFGTGIVVMRMKRRMRTRFERIIHQYRSFVVNSLLFRIESLRIGP